MDQLPGLWRSPFERESFDPVRTLRHFQREMNHLFEDFRGEEPRHRVAMNVEDKNSHYLLTFEVPGFSSEDLHVEVRDDWLHVYGEKSEEGKGKVLGGRYSAMEEWFSLPLMTDLDAIEAQIRDGVLRIAVPKPEHKRVSRIPIGEEKPGFFARLLGHSEKEKAS